MHKKFESANNLSRYAAFLVFRSTNLNLAKRVPQVNSTLPMTRRKFFFSFALSFIAAYTMQVFEYSAHYTVNTALAACCLPELYGIY